MPRAVTQIVVRIPRKSSVSRTLFVGLVNPPADPNAAPDVLVPVSVDEVAGGTPTGTFDMVYLNPDFENPDFENPDFENAELHNPDFENPDFENPDFENPDFENFTLTASSVDSQPGLREPGLRESRTSRIPTSRTPTSRTRTSRIPTSRIPTSRTPTSRIRTSKTLTSRTRTSRTAASRSSDTTWPVRNNGNTTSAYKTNVFVNDPPAGVQVPAGGPEDLHEPRRGLRTCPASTAGACLTAQSVPLVNIVGPERADQSVRSQLQRSEPRQRDVLPGAGRARHHHAARVLSGGRGRTARAT